ncbi:MAG: hypothetical protein V7605_814 [Acidimicrobiaceae bacterium]|jgi:hypothetical protein
MAGEGSGEWFWCLRHQRPEQGEGACEAEQRLGPYASEAEARAWKDKVEDRNEEWDAEDRRWEGD